MRQDTSSKQGVLDPAPNTVPGSTCKGDTPEPEVIRGVAAKAMLEGGISEAVLQMLPGVSSKAIPGAASSTKLTTEPTAKPTTTPKKAAPANNPDIPGLLSARRKVMGLGARYRIAEGVLAEEVHISITPETTVPCYVFTPPGLDSDAELDTIIHVPGTAGKQFVDKAEHVMGSHIAAETGCRVIIPSHRFAPENRWPIPYNDVLRLVNKLLSADGPFNIDRVGLSGYSSGTLIAAQLYLRALKETPCPFAQLFLIAPATDVDASTHLQPHPDPAVNSKQFPSSCFTGFGELMLPEGMDGTSSLISPQYIPQEFYEGKGIVHIVIGELDARIEHVRKFRDTLKAAGVRVHYQEIKECQNCSGCEVCENGLPNHGLPWNNPTFVSVMADEIKQVFAEAEKPDEFVELEKMPRFANRQGVLASITERYKALNYVRHIDPQMPDFSLADHQRLMMVDTGKRKLDISHEEYFTGDKQPIRWQALFNEQNSDAKQCYAITAPPGGGKSSLLHHIVTRFYQGLVGEPGFEAELPDWLQFDWAVHIRLRDMVRYQGQEFGKDFTLRDVLYDLFFRGVKDNKGRLLDEKYFERAITAILKNPDKVLLCLDGLDELSNDDTCQTIYDELLKTFKHHLISGRPQAMQEYTQDKAYGVLEIQGLKQAQQQDYARNYCVKQLARETRQNLTVMRECYGKKSQVELEQATDDPIAQTLHQRQTAVLDLLAEQVQLPTHIPVILDIFCFLAMDIVSGKLKAESLNNQSQWYRAMIGKLLERFNRERGVKQRCSRGAPPDVVEDSKAWRFLVALAGSHDFLEPVFSYEDIKTVIEKLIEQHKDFTQQDIDDLFEPHGLLNCGLLVKSSSAEYSYEFLHLSMQEFFMAYGLAKKIENPSIEVQQQAKKLVHHHKTRGCFRAHNKFLAGLLEHDLKAFNTFLRYWHSTSIHAGIDILQKGYEILLLEGIGQPRHSELVQKQQAWIQAETELLHTARNYHVLPELHRSPYLIQQIFNRLETVEYVSEVQKIKSRLCMLRCFSQYQLTSYLTDLANYLVHDDIEVRKLACFSVRELGRQLDVTESIRAGILANLQYAEWSIRESMVFAIRKLQVKYLDETILTAFLRSLSDESCLVAYTAQCSLRELEVTDVNESVINLLVGYLEHDDVKTRERACEAAIGFRKTMSGIIFAKLTNNLQHEDANVKGQALLALTHWHQYRGLSEDFFSLLITELKVQDATACGKLYNAIYDLGKQAIRPDIIKQMLLNILTPAYPLSEPVSVIFSKLAFMVKEDIALQKIFTSVMADLKQAGKLPDVLSDIIQLIFSADVGVSRQAFDTVQSLASARASLNLRHDYSEESWHKIIEYASKQRAFREQRSRSKMDWQEYADVIGAADNNIALRLL